MQSRLRHSSLGLVIGVPFGRGESWASYWASQNWANYLCVLNRKITPNRDALISDLYPTRNYGVFTNLAVGQITANQETTRSLMDFDLSAIGDDYVLQDVSLSLWYFSDAATNTRSIKVYRLKRPWVEGTGNNTVTGDGVDWLTYDGVNAWQTAGGFGVNDCDQTPIGELSIAHDLAINGWVTIPLNVTKKSDLTLGHGILLKMDVEDDDGHVFRGVNYATASQRPYLKLTVNGLANGTESPLLTKNSSNPQLLTAQFGSVWYNGVNDWVMHYSDNTNILRATSTDGINWVPDTTNNPILTPASGKLNRGMYWREGSNHYMFYHGTEWAGGIASMGMAYSSDGISWTKEPTNPVLIGPITTIGSQTQIDANELVKVGNTYYAIINDISVVPRSSGIATSTDLKTWTKHASNPTFTNGRYCGAIIKYLTKYYLFIPYTPEGEVTEGQPLKNRFELYRDDNPTFLSGEREYLGVVMFGGATGAWDDRYLDTPVIVTDNIYKNTYSAGNDKDGRLWMYYSATSNALVGITDWGMGLAVGHLEMLPELTAITEPSAGE